MSRVFSSATFRLNFAKRASSCRWKRSASRLYWKLTTKIVSESDEVGLSLTLRLEPLLEPQIENKMQVDISQQRADRPALWSSLFASRDDPILHYACIEPLTNQTQNDRVGNAIGNHPAQPGMINVVEVSPDVGFENLAHLLGHDLHA